MYLVYRILVIILIVSFVTGIMDIIYEHKHHLKKESIAVDNSKPLLEEEEKKEIIIDDEEII